MLWSKSVESGGEGGAYDGTSQSDSIANRMANALTLTKTVLKSAKTDVTSCVNNFTVYHTVSVPVAAEIYGSTTDCPNTHVRDDSSKQ